MDFLFELPLMMLEFPLMFMLMMLGVLMVMILQPMLMFSKMMVMMEVLLMDLFVGAIFRVMVDFDPLVTVVLFPSILNRLRFGCPFNLFSPSTDRPLFSIMLRKSCLIDSSLASFHRHRSLALLGISQDLVAGTPLHVLRSTSSSGRSLAPLLPQIAFSIDYSVRSTVIGLRLISLVNKVSLRLRLGDDVVVEVISFGPVWNGNRVGIVHVFFSMVVEDDIGGERRVDEVVVFLTFEIRRLFSEVFNEGSLVVSVEMDFRLVLNESFLRSKMGLLHLL